MSLAMPSAPKEPLSVDQTQSYDENKVQVLEGVEHVRKRPSMYIGDTGARGLHHLVYEVVDNAIDEAMAGVCKNIGVTLHSDGSVSVQDDGRGFPVGIKPEFNMSAIELCLTKLGAGAKFDRDSYKVSGGLHGVGVSCVNALSERCDVQTLRDGQIWAIGFERGRTTRALQVVGTTLKSGSTVRFKPDPEIFPETNFHYVTLANRLRELAYLNSGLSISLTDEREGKSETFAFERGIAQFVEHLNEGKTGLHNVLSIRHDDPQQRLILEVALQYTDGYTETSMSFVNNINTVEGGTHLSAFRASLTRAMNNYAKKSNLFKANDPTPSGEDIREGLTAIISVLVPEPQFEGQTKTKLGNSEVGTFVETTLNEMLGNYLEEHPADAKRLVNKAVQAAQAREAARKARETARKSAMSGAGMSRKLVDCSSRDVDETELFIVEGDSAAGSAKGYRDATTQAILPIRGKILNVEKARLHKVLSHEEILEIIKALGTGIGDEDFDLSKLRYGRIILMTDADVDGSHIRTLLLTFLFRHMRPLIEKGVVYIAQPPLFQVKKGKRAEYVLNDVELNRKLTQLGMSDTRLEVRRPGAAPRQLDAAAMAALLGLMEDVEQQARVLSRRGLELRAFVEQHARDGRLPTQRISIDGAERFVYSEAEADTARAQLSGGQIFLRTELPESRELERCFGRLAEFGMGIADLFLKREEQVTGDRSPAYFVLLHGQERFDIENLADLPNGVRAIGSRGWEVKRFKGLGEMNKEELWETTMDPKNRVMLRVVVGQASDDPEQENIDAAEADRVFSLLMGENVEKRKEFIDQNAVRVKNLDI